ncbi:MAG: translation initiation factor IF-2 [Planctomycetaceae bacterium]|nr:translation initiation factor IF-2 [Planctomycetaceae bacterium]
MRVSELAKELGYKAAELVELAKAKGIKVEDARANIDARLAAAVRAQVPHRSKLTANPALMDVYTRVVTEEAARAAAKAAEPKPEKPPPKLNPDGTEAPKTKRVTKKKEPAAAGAVEAKSAGKKEDPKAPAKTPVKKAKVAMEFRLGATDAKAPGKPGEHKHVELTPEEQEEIKKAAATPLIDVDKVIGEAKELHAMRPIEIEVFTRDTQVEESKEKRQHVKPVTGAAKPAAPVAPVRPTPPSARPGTPAYAGQRPPMPPPSQHGWRPRPQPMHHSRPSMQPSKPRPVITPMAERKIEITVPITIKSFCEQTGIKISQVMKKLMDQGAMIMNQNAVLDEDMVGILAAEFKRDVTIVKEKSAEDEMHAAASEVKDDPKDLVVRAPVVTFMGHVDHGKTSLLDKIRNANVAKGESGGITQHIGAYKIKTADGRPVVFLDTPGHEAFTAMRSRGAKATDVAVIVVDAADGVMPQTEEAINHAKAAGVKIVVALNKIDKPQANPNKVKGQLSALGLQPAGDWGGDTECCEVSAITGQGVDHLVEVLALEADLLELKANPKRAATGVVLEARKTDDRGVVATILVQNGTLKRGDVILAGPGYGRVRSMQDHTGKTVDAAGPATPVELTGLVEVPDAGDTFQVVSDIQQAKEIAETRAHKTRESQLLERQHVTMEGLFKQIEDGKLKEIRIILKVDVQGSLQVLKEALPGLSTDEVKLKLLHSSVGSITEGDILLADASDALVIGFHVDVEPRAAEAAKDRGVEIKTYTVIYQAIEEMKAALEGLLEPELVEQKTGHATVKEVFRISRVGAIAGCILTDGKIERSNQVRLYRDGKVVHTGKLESLKRFKDDVKEVAEGYECGIKISGHDDVRKGDQIEAFAIQKIARKLEKKQK